MTIASSRQAMKFPVGSCIPPAHVRAVRSIESGQLYQRDDFDCFTRTGDEAIFTWETLNHRGTDWPGVELVEVIEFTRPEVLFSEVQDLLQTLERDVTALIDLELLTAPLPVVAMIAAAQREIRQVAKMCGVKLDG